MARASESPGYEVVCPHCGKQFQAELLSAESDRHRGFKCPHCRLFVAYSRVEEPAVEEEQPTQS